MTRVRVRLLALVALAGLAGCGDKAGTASVDQASAPAAPVVDPNVAVADGETQKWVKEGMVSTIDFRDVLRVPASASVDETRVARIGASVTGRVTDLNAVVGQDVQRGQMLAQLNSTELSTAQLAFLRAFSAKLLAERAAERAKQLFEADVIGAAELQRRETELAQAQADMSASYDQLKVLGMSDTSIVKLEQTRTVNSQSFVVASISGTVIERTVAQGQVVQ
ncbi:MAG: efflux RND transporter periplasmic adaptor subunit, partial [Burkholderiales bacterium]|nr:efflux RND transporter periplasmic adaptor subunit [Burkholderiales bacterium]